MATRSRWGLRMHIRVIQLFIITTMAKQVSKKSAKAVKAADGEKKKKRSGRSETYSTYVYRVLKQVHPGMCAYDM